MQLAYAAYVRNCKFTSPTTLPFIQLMQHSLVEIGRIDVSLTYRYMFVYIRQLAIHLRNAITVKKKVRLTAVFCISILVYIVKSFSGHKAHSCSTDLCTYNSQPDTSLHCKITYTVLVHCTVCMFTSQLSLVLIAPMHEGMAKLSSLGGWL